MVPPIHRTFHLQPSDDGERERLQLSILGAFDLRDQAETVVLSGGTQRLLVFVALQGREN